MIPTTLVGWLLLALAAFVVGFFWSAGAWVFSRLHS